MSGGIGSVGGRGSDELYARLESIGRPSGGGILSGLDGDANVRSAAERLAAQPRISGADVEALVREASDMGGVNASERRAIASLLERALDRFDPTAKDALVRWLGPDAPAAARAPAATPAPAASTTPVNPGAVRILASTTGTTSTSGATAAVTAAAASLVSSRRPTFSSDAQLSGVLAGRATLAQNARGNGVAEVQRALLDLGYDLGSSGADGAFGPGMKAAVQRFQRSQGLGADGVVGKGTLEALARAAKPDPRSSLRSPLVSGPVGPRQANGIADVKAVQERLADLGFYRGKINGKYDDALGKALRVFDAASKGETTSAHAGQPWRDASTLAPGEDTESWLRAQNAPRWQRIAASGTGWRNADDDGYSYATSWMQDTINRAGARFQPYVAAHPGTPVMHTNDASTRTGGDNHDHDTHESGLSLDVNLGRGSITMTHRDYDREATWAQIEAFLADPDVTRVLFNDAELIRRADADPRYAGRVQSADGHHHHLHVDIRAPARIDS